MASSYSTAFSTFAQPFLLSAVDAPKAINFNRGDIVMPMNQQDNLVTPPPTKRRNQRGNPHPDAEVVALSPEKIMEKHRFLCEVCNKGFQREQNLQLHRRAHNLSWKLKQRTNTETLRRKVYVCPVPSCIHHDPTRALGDLTGIRKHYLRKHGEKRLTCGKCSKRYAVQSDLKAHIKICGTSEYRCLCNTIFSRRDGYMSHIAFCNALRQESARNPNMNFNGMTPAVSGGGDGGRHAIYGDAPSSALSYNNFDNNPHSVFTPLADGYHINRLSSDNFEDFVAQSANNYPGLTNYLMQRSSNQGLLAQNNMSLMNHYGQSSLGGNMSLTNSLASTTDLQGQFGGSSYEFDFPKSRSMGGSGRLTLDLLGVNGVIANNANYDHSGVPLDVEMKYSHPNNPFGNV